MFVVSYKICASPATVRSYGDHSVKGPYIWTYSLGSASSRVIPRKLDSVSTRNAACLMACINLLRYEWLRRSNENKLALRKPSIDYRQRLARIIEQR